MENKKIKMYGRSKQVIVEVPKPRKETKRLPKEIKEWSKYNDEEQLQVIEISRNRMDGWQRKAFDKAYKEKVETGTSPLKKQKLQD